MAKVFLDTNIFIDIVEERDSNVRDSLVNHVLCVSVASLNVWLYIYKHKMPSTKYSKLFDTLTFVDSTLAIAKKSFLGPTSDFEDNIQLHSASDAGCDVFVTKDKGLLKLGYFGKVRITDSI